MNKVIIPLIRRVMPGIIASDLISVQPMADMFVERLESGVSYDPENDMPEWYWVKCHNSSISKYVEMSNFCKDTFGENGGEHWMSGVYDIHLHQFAFTTEQDQLLFLLRWA